MESLEEVRNRLLREDRVQQMVRMRAYEIYKMRGGQPGWESHDWFQAEGEVLAFLIAIESRLEDEEAVPEAGIEGSAPAAAPIYEAPETIEEAAGKDGAGKKPKPRSASKVTSAKTAKKTFTQTPSPAKPEPSKGKRTRKPSKPKE
jgi:hypothetical protein